MGSFVYEYGIFLAKAITVALAIVAVVSMITRRSRRDRRDPNLRVERLDDRFRAMADILQHSIMNKAAWKEYRKARKKEIKDNIKGKSKNKESATQETRRRIYVLDFKGDSQATAVANLREEISALTAVATDRDEVVVRLENSGGTVHAHGLAASQLMRVKDRSIPLTVIVDKVAASGGYLMACVADRFIAAPFAIIGSIGVITQTPNFHRVLESQGIDFEEITAGQYKRTVTMFGENTEEDRAKVKEELEDVHTLFKQLVVKHRPELDIESVATGEYWYGTRALELGLVDQLGTSDDYLIGLAPDADIFGVTHRGKQTVRGVLSSSVESLFERIESWISEWRNRSQYP